MTIINELLELEKTIKILYLKLVEDELNNNIEEYNIVKELLTTLIQRENIIIKKIFANNNLLFELDNFLILNTSDDYGLYDEIFMKELDSEYDLITLSRIYARFNNNIIYLNNEQISKLSDTNWLLNLGISTNKLEELNIFNFNIMSITYLASLKLELSSVNEYLNTFSNKDDDYKSLIYYKYMLIYANPSLEKYLLNNQKIDLKKPDIFNKYNEYSIDYKKVYQANIIENIIPSINSVVNMLLTADDYQDYNCSKEVIEFLYLTSIKSNLYLLNGKEFLTTKNSILKGITNNLNYLSKIGKQQEVLKLKEVLDRCEKIKIIKK